MEEFRRRKDEQRSSVDFGDVFGGPPRTLFLWQPGQSQPHNRLLFYDEIFNVGDDGVDHRIRADPNPLPPPPPPRRTRNLPAFIIPGGGRRGSVRGNQGFYDGVFSQEARSPSAADSGSRSRSSSSSESTSPRPPSIHDDVALSAVASMLKPIIVPSQGHRLRMNESSSEQNTRGNLTVASVGSYMDFAEPSSGSCKQSAGKLVEHPPSLSAQSLHMMKSPYDKAGYCNQLETNTPSSVTISVVHEPDSLMEMSDKGFRDDEGETDFMGRCLIEIVPKKRGESETAGAVDDAIAWAKETLRTGKLEDF